jgi:hypothetical protein
MTLRDMLSRVTSSEGRDRPEGSEITVFHNSNDGSDNIAEESRTKACQELCHIEIPMSEKSLLNADSKRGLILLLYL